MPYNPKGTKRRGRGLGDLGVQLNSQFLFRGGWGNLGSLGGRGDPGKLIKPTAGGQVRKVWVDMGANHTKNDVLL